MNGIGYEIEAPRFRSTFDAEVIRCARAVMDVGAATDATSLAIVEGSGMTFEKLIRASAFLDVNDELLLEAAKGFVRAPTVREWMGFNFYDFKRVPDPEWRERMIARLTAITNERRAR